MDHETEFIPDYLHDLNAMHEAEKVLTDEQDLEYSEALEQVVKGRFATANSEDMRRLRSATASQRAEAFLRTIGKWEECKMNHSGDANKMVSDTPRTTDRVVFIDGNPWVNAPFARGLERELNAANESFRKLNIHTLNLVDRIRRLEEAGDALYENSYPTRWDLPEANARKLKEQEAWLKAKEDKP